MSDRRTDEKCDTCGSWLRAQGDYRYCPLSGTVGHIRMEQEQREPMSDRVDTEAVRHGDPQHPTSDSCDIIGDHDHDTDFFYGVFAPTWKDDRKLVWVLRDEAEYQDTEMGKALMLHVADRVESLLAAPQVAPEPERCPTCGSDNPMVYITGTPQNPDRERCNNPWHRPAPLVEGEQGHALDCALNVKGPRCSCGWVKPRPSGSTSLARRGER